ncbi:hypothetical protein PhaeoP66_03235 [Phaeobacter inhibens]|uniref:Uncharacterized protein n=2 Tax=Phaeobacter inhibens TaxID=221822 RepID=A0ABM6RHL1_9RHOB|nr:hypothetical protein PhaeoP66_03235 [Phaeobacter inhibens]
MANPLTYVKDYDFSAFQELRPSTPLPGDRLDVELQNIEDALDSVIAAVANVRRSDGKLQNAVVMPESLSDELLQLMSGTIPPPDTGLLFLLDGVEVGRARTFDLTGTGASLAIENNVATLDVPGATAGAKTFATGQALRDDETASYPVGTILSVAAESTSYIVASPVVTDQDLTTTGGVKAYENGPVFSDMYRLRAALIRGDLRDGQQVSCYGQSYTVDSTATGLESAFWDFGVDGLRRIGDHPDNVYLMTAFPDQDRTHQNMYLSRNGSTLRRLNQFPIKRGEGGANTGGRDSQPFWSRKVGQIIMPVTGPNGSPYDFSFYFMNALGDPEIVNCQIPGTNQYGGVRDTVLPGATRAADTIWGPRFHNVGDAVWMTISLRTQDNYEDGFGNDSQTMRPYLAEVLAINDTPGAQSITLGPPVAMDIATPTTAMLEPDITQGDDGTWFVCIKNSENRNIEIHSGPSLFARFTKLVTLDLDNTPDPDDETDPNNTLDSLEGPIWVRRVYYDAATGAKRLQISVQAAHNRGPTNELIGVPVEFISSGGPEGPYGPAQDVNNGHSMRNGDIVNIALEPDPRALPALLAAAASYGGQYPAQVERAILLPEGTKELTPQQDVLYVVDGADYVCDLTIDAIEGRRFWLGCLSPSAGTKINVQNNANCVGPVVVGGNGFEIREVLYVEDILDKYLVTSSYLDGSGGSGLSDWSEDANGNFIPTVDGKSIGNSDNRVRGLVFQARKADGTVGTNHAEAFRAENGAPKFGAIGDTTTNNGEDFAMYETFYTPGITSGVHIWNPGLGCGMRFAALTGDLEIDMANMKNGFGFGFYIPQANSHTLTLTTSDTIEWITSPDPAVLSGGHAGAVLIGLRQISGGLILGAAVEK